MQNINEIICEAINYAIAKHCKNCKRDFTYICEVTEVYPDNPNHYQLTHNGANYMIATKNVELSLHDRVHMVVPCGNFKNKFIIEDIK